MTPQQFRHFVQELRQLFIDKHRSDYKVGSALHAIREGRLWERWPRDDRREPGYESFTEFCDRELGYSVSQANQKATNFEKLRGIGLDETGDTFSRCMRLGWSKLNVLLRVAQDETNLVAWLNHIEGKNLTELQLRASIEDARARHAGGRGDTSDADGTRQRTGGEGEPDPPERATTRGYVTYQVQFENQESLDHFTNTVGMIRRRYGDVGMGRALSMMAVHYLTTVPTQAQGGATIEVENLVRTFEQAYGIRLQVVTPEREQAQRRGKRKRSKSLRSLSDDAR